MAHTPITRARDLEKRRLRRAEWLRATGPCASCGSWDDLEVDHKIPGAKLSHNLWSWAHERRSRELAKCQPLCRDCHKRKTAQHQREVFSGKPHIARRKISDRQLIRAQELRDSGWTVREIAKKFGVTHPTIATLTARIENGVPPAVRN